MRLREGRSELVVRCVAPIGAEWCQTHLDGNGLSGLVRRAWRLGDGWSGLIGGVWGHLAVGAPRYITRRGQEASTERGANAEACCRRVIAAIVGLLPVNRRQAYFTSAISERRERLCRDCGARQRG